MPYTNKTKLTMLHSVCVADYQIYLGKVEAENEPSLFFCAARDLVVDKEPPLNLTLTHSRGEIADAYTDLVAEATRHIANHVLDRDANGIRVPRYNAEDFPSLDDVDYIYDKVLVLNSSQLLSNYETGADQLVFCVEEPVDGGTGEFIQLLTNDPIYTCKDDIIGVLRDEDVPEWAQAPLARLREQEDKW